MANASTSRVTFEHQSSSVLGIGTATPRLSWKITSAPAQWKQSHYQLRITRQGNEATSGEQEFTAQSPEQLLIAWPGEPLASHEQASVQVRVAGSAWSTCDEEEPVWGPWSEEATVEAGLLNPTDWQARFISPVTPMECAPVLSRTFSIDGPTNNAADSPADTAADTAVDQARLYITAHGIYQVRINGQLIEQDHLAPGWTSYHHRLHYQTYDVSQYLQSGENTIAVTVGSGWWHGRIGYEHRTEVYGDRPALLAQLHVQTGGGEQVIATDESWLVGPSEVLEHSLFDGQTTDLRTAIPAPSQPVELVDFDLRKVIAPVGPGVGIVDELRPVELTKLADQHWRIDFGQNIVGWVRLQLPQARGQEVVLRHAEVLEHGELGVRPLRTAKATDTFLLPDDAASYVLEPAFTFHGFRYAEVHGIDELQAGQLTGVALSSARTRTGWFECSNELVNQLHQNVVWGMLGNFVSVPTDCPQRDERLGWTGDLQVFAPTANYLFDVDGFLDNWLDDLAADQHPNGAVPWVVPSILWEPSPPTAAWGDAAVIVPWEQFLTTGDPEQLAKNLPSMRAFVDSVIKEAGAADSEHGRLWLGGFQFGDWLDPDAPPANSFAAKTDRDLVATACFFRCATTLATAYEQVGDLPEAQKYSDIAAEVRTAFLDAYVTTSGRMVSDSVTAYAITICWGIARDPELQARLGKRLADVVRARDFRVSTGFVGTPVVTHALSLTGHTEVAYRLLLQDQCPSWLYPITMGATTIWERWDAMLPDGSINPGQMTSFNHYAFGAVAEWLHQNVAGLRRVAPQYSRVVIAPEVTHQLSYANTTYESPYGRIYSGWERTADGIIVRAEIPVGVKAYVELPDSQNYEVSHGSHEWLSADVPQPAAPSQIRDVLDDAALWQEVVAHVQDLGYVTDTAEAAERVGRALDRPLELLPLQLSPPFKAQFEPQISERISPLLTKDVR